MDSKNHSCGSFFTPDISDEVRISLLKELLHNSWVRSDKAAYLLENMNNCVEALSTDYFDADAIENVRLAIINKEYYVPKISRALKLSVLRYNLRNHWAKTFKNVMTFIIVKYLLKNNYHRKITEL